MTYKPTKREVDHELSFRRNYDPEVRRRMEEEDRQRLIQRADGLDREVLRRMEERDRRRWNLAYWAANGDREQDRAMRELAEVCGG